MNTRIFLLTMTVLAFLQGPLLPSVFLEGLPLLILAQSLPLQNSLPAAFSAGIIFDLVQAQTLGVSSAIFVLFTIFAVFVSSRVPARHPLVVVFFILVLNFSRAQLVGGNVVFATLVAGSLAVFLLGRRLSTSGKLRL